MTDLLQLPGGALGQVCAEVLAALSAEEPRSNRDIFDACPSALEAMDLSKAFHALRQRGLIVEAGRAEPPKGRGSRSGKTYLLSEAAANARLAEHLERELAESPPFSPPETALAERVDEEARAPDACDTCYSSTSILTGVDPVYAEIDRLSEPRMLGADEHARFLLVLAESPVFRRTDRIRERLAYIARELEAIA